MAFLQTILRGSAVAVLLWAAPAAAPASNLLVNGGFETGNTSPWGVFSPGTQSFQITPITDPEFVVEGQFAAAITTVNPTSDIGIIFQEVQIGSLPPNSLVRVEGTIRGDGAQFVDPSAGVRPIVVLYAPNDQIQTYSAGHGDFAGDFAAIDYSITIQLPPNPGRLGVQLLFDSGLASGRVIMDDFKAYPIDRSELGPLEFTDARVEPDAHGVPRLRIAGEPVVPGFFFGNVGNPVIYEEAALATAAGVNLYQFPMNLPWAGTSTSLFKRVLQENPDAYFLPRVELYPPIHIFNAFADQQYLNERGEAVQSGSGSLPEGITGITPGSSAFYNAVQDQVALLLEIVHSSDIADRFIGYHFSNMETGEWFYPQTNSSYWDYAPANKQAYRIWLLQRYGNVGAINAAWGTDYPSIVPIEPPTAVMWEAGVDGFFRSPSQSVEVVDYIRFMNSQVVLRMSQLAAQVKDTSGGQSLVAYFYGYLHELIGNGARRGMAHSGHLALEQMLDDPNVDLLASPLSYFHRGVGFPVNLMAPVDSLTRAGKIFLQEDDSRTHIWTDPPPASSLFYPTEWDSIQALRRNAGHPMVRRQAIWWMDLLANGNYNLESYWTQANRFFLEAAEAELAQPAPYRPEIAVLVDEESYRWMRADSFDIHSPALFQLRTGLHSLGAPVGWYTTRDLEHLPDSVKLIVFPNLFKVEEAMLDRLDAVKSGGRTLLFLYAPGYVGSDGLSTASMQAATGFEFTRLGTSASTRVLLQSNMDNLAGGLSGQLSGTTTSLAPRFAVADAQPDEALGRYVVTNQTAFAWRTHADWNAVFHGSPIVDVRVLRALALRSGVGVRVDADRIGRVDGITTDDRFVFAYAIGEAGPRSFLAPGERVPNGHFDPATTVLHSSGVGRWVAPVVGSPTASLVQEDGVDFARVGPYAAASGEYNAPLGIRIHAQRGAAYEVLARVRLSGYASLDPDSYLFINFQPDPFGPEAATLKLAEAGSALVPDGEWIELAAQYQHLGGAAAPNDLLVQVQLLGAQSFDHLDIDLISVREAGAPLVDVRDVVADEPIAERAAHWTAEFVENEQRIFEVRPAQGPPAAVPSWAHFD